MLLWNRWIRDLYAVVENALNRFFRASGWVPRGRFEIVQRSNSIQNRILEGAEILVKNNIAGPRRAQLVLTGILPEAGAIFESPPPPSRKNGKPRFHSSHKIPFNVFGPRRGVERIEAIAS